MATERPVPVIADVDTGVDDALALLFLARHPGIDLRGVSAVAGNVDADTAARNTLDVLAVAGAADVPVARGATRPLINPARDARAVHGANGLGDVELPRSPADLRPEAGIELIRNLIEASAEPITLLGLGPATDLALFVRTYPDHAARLERIVLMGGSASVGNATAVAEFNAWHDPEALAIVIGSGVPVLMYGLDVFYRPVVSAEQIDRLDRGDDASRLAGQLLAFSAEREKLPAGSAEPPSLGATLGDAGAAFLLTDPDAVTVADLPVQVVLAGAARGQTMVDRRGFVGESELHGIASAATTIGVALDCDPHRIVDGYLAALTPTAGLSSDRAERTGGEK